MSKSIQQSLISGFTIFAIGPMLVVIAALGWHDFRENQRNVLVRQNEIVTRLAVEVNALIQTPLYLLRTTAKSHGLKGHDLDSLYQDLNILLSSNRSFRKIVSINPNGREVFQVAWGETSHSSQGRDWSHEPAFTIPKTQGRLYYGSVEFDEMIGEPFMVIATPVYTLRDGELRSIIASTIHLKGIWDMLAEQRDGADQEIFIMDEKRRVIAHQNPSVVLNGTVSTRDEDDGFLTGLSGRWVAAASREIAIGDSTFRIVAERNGLSAVMPAVESTALVVMIISIALVVIMFLLFRALRHIAWPIQVLARAVQGIGDGDFSQRVEVEGENEIGTLGKAFNVMAANLEQTLNALRNEVSERKKYEVELDKHRNQLEELVNDRTRELRDTQDELVRKERLATLGQLTATVSHELRNPLGAMRPSLYIMQKRLGDDADEKLLQAYDRIDRNIDRCDHIIDELLDFTRIAGLNLEKTPVDEWLESLIEEYKIPEDILLEKSFSLGDLELPVDSNGLRRAVFNVLDNACQAMQEQSGEARKGSCLGIKTGATDKRIEIRISDTGTGISGDILEKIFEPLFSTKSFGVGLGMTTVKQIMEQHDGGIDVESEAGKSTTVTLWLPGNESS